MFSLQKSLFTFTTTISCIFLVTNSPNLAGAASVTPKSSMPNKASWNQGRIDLEKRANFKNPISPKGKADPWVMEWNNTYYLTCSEGQPLKVHKSNNLDSLFEDKNPASVWTVDSKHQEIWAPELHRIDNNFYIYVTLNKKGDKDGTQRRMYVLKGTDPNDPTKPFDLVGQIGTEDNNWAIDGTVMQNYNGANYFIWSGWENTSKRDMQNLYIAKMDSPTSTTGKRVLLHSPRRSDGSKIDWQWTGKQGINEGPEILVHNNRTFLIYSAAASYGPDYSLAQMSLKSQSEDPLNPDSWITNNDGPVFKKSNDTVGVGHASFATGPSDRSWIVYHGMDADETPGWNARSVRIQSFNYASNGSPSFPAPIAQGKPIRAPEGF